MKCARVPGISTLYTLQYHVRGVFKIKFEFIRSLLPSYVSQKLTLATHGGDMIFFKWNLSDLPLHLYHCLSTVN